MFWAGLAGQLGQPAGGVAEVLVGRSGELALIGAFVERACTGGDTLLLFGEPGAGKTALLDAAAGAASDAGILVLRAAGAEFEADLAFSGLHQVLLPLLDVFGQLSAAHRDPLNVALGYGEGPPPDRLLVSTATLTVLRQAAAASPVLVIADDLPWLDRASAGVLAFVARRLAGSRAGFLAASRPEPESFFERAGLAQHELGPLDEQAASGLLSSRFPELAPRVRQRVVAEAQGNPLALLELPAALSGAQRAAAEALPVVLPLSRRLQALFASRASALPAPARWLLLLAVLDGSGDLRVLQAAAGQQQIEDLAPAEQAGLVRVDDRTGRLVFRHPLTRSAIVELSTSGDRRRAHRALAAQLADQPERRAWHLGEAAIEPDEQIAGLLEETAQRILRRADAVGAVSALLRAAELSPARADRSRRLAQAAFVGASVTLEVDTVSPLLSDARQAGPESGTSLLTAAAAAFVLLNGDGDVITAHRLLTQAIEDQAKPYRISDTGVFEAVSTLFMMCWLGGRPELWASFHTAIGGFTPEVPMDLYLLGQTNADPVRTAAAVLPEVDAAIASLRERDGPVAHLDDQHNRPLHRPAAGLPGGVVAGGARKPAGQRGHSADHGPGSSLSRRLDDGPMGPGAGTGGRRPRTLPGPRLSAANLDLPLPPGADRRGPWRLRRGGRPDGRNAAMGHAETDGPGRPGGPSCGVGSGAGAG